MELNDTIVMMGSKDYQERFRAEYYQLTIRMTKLSEFLYKYSNGQLNITPSCSQEILQKQLDNMEEYKDSLLERAIIENIKLQ